MLQRRRQREKEEIKTRDAVRMKVEHVSDREAQQNSLRKSVEIMGETTAHIRLLAALVLVRF